jgi:YD repeat-containing protein
VTREIRADGTTDTLYTYDSAGRLTTVTDPMDQVTTYTYNVDGSLASTGFTNETIATPDISHTYDSYYPRPATMVDGNGTTTYSYVARVRMAPANCRVWTAPSATTPSTTPTTSSDASRRGC